MTRVLGAACTSSAAYFALIEDGTVTDEEPHRVAVPALMSGGDELIELKERLRRLLRGATVEAIAILTTTYKPRSYQECAARASFETVVRVAAAELGITCEYITARKVRSRLGLSQSGLFRAVLREHFDEEHDPYWWPHRAEAAAAALGWLAR